MKISNLTNQKKKKIKPFFTDKELDFIMAKPFKPSKARGVSSTDSNDLTNATSKLASHQEK